MDEWLLIWRVFNGLNILSSVIVWVILLRLLSAVNHDFKILKSDNFDLQITICKIHDLLSRNHSEAIERDMEKCKHCKLYKEQ